MKTVIGLYDRFEDAQQSVTELHDAGYRGEDISMVARDATGEYSRYFENQEGQQKQDVAGGAATGAGIGAVLGGLGGLLVGLGALAIPGIGPVLAAGPLVSTLAGAGIGAVAGGVVGALVDLGVPEEHAQYYAEGIRRGGTLVVVRTDDERADQAMTIMNRYSPVDINQRSQTWRQNNWQYDPDAEPLTADDMEFNRSSQHSNIPITGTDSGTDSMDMRGDLNRDIGHDVSRGSMSDMGERDLLEHDMDDDTDSDIPVTGGMSSMPVMEEDLYEEVDFSTPRDVNQSNDLWRGHYQTMYSTSGRDFEYYHPAYGFGNDLASDTRYSNYEWDQVEPVARRDWERRGIEGKWEDVKDAVRYAWDQMRF